VPGANSARDKSMASADPTGKRRSVRARSPKGAGGTYVVKSGDSLAKIAKATGSSIDDSRLPTTFRPVPSALARN
jgi:hypothetical protein